MDAFVMITIGVLAAVIFGWIGIAACIAAGKADEREGME